MSQRPTVHTMHEPGLSDEDARGKMAALPSPPKFDDKLEEREYQKGRLALAFRIFAKLGFDEGVAGHITLRVSYQFLRIPFVCSLKVVGSRGPPHFLG